MLLDDKYLYSSFHVHEERQIKFEINYEPSTQTTRYMDMVRDGKCGHMGYQEFVDLKIVVDAKKLTIEQSEWLDSQKNRDKKEELLSNLVARRTWGLNPL